jgi:putative membrane protein
MMKLIARWIISAVSLLIVARVVPGFVVKGFGAALTAAAIIGLVNSTLGPVLKLLTLPLSIVTFGLFLLVINAFMLKLASSLVSGFVIQGFAPAFFGAIVLTLVSMVLRYIFFEKDR